MDARDELAAILRDAADAAVDAGLPVLTFDGYAEAVVAAGWRSAPTLIIDPAELDDLPEGTVILDPMGLPMQLCDNRGSQRHPHHRRPSRCHCLPPSCTFRHEIPIHAGCY